MLTLFTFGLFIFVIHKIISFTPKGIIIKLLKVKMWLRYLKLEILCFCLNHVHHFFPVGYDLDIGPVGYDLDIGPVGYDLDVGLVLI